MQHEEKSKCRSISYDFYNTIKILLKLPKKRDFNIEENHEKQEEESVDPEKTDQKDDFLAEDENEDIQG